MTPIDWLAAAAIAVLLYFVVLLIDNIFKKGQGIARALWKKNIVLDFPYPDGCWDCRKGSCRGCDLLKRGNGF